MIPIWVFILFMVVFILIVVIVNIYVAQRFVNYWTERLIQSSDEHYDAKVVMLVDAVEDIREKVEVLGTPYSKGMVAGMDAVIEQVKRMEAVK